ncbi:MAG: agmatinase [Candidatus Micrarchaeota archaeon]|nr:agmatinase [Candidatus Micrarchaeota archaeon]MDE1849962.1 agmatinase [Candidatus Micrarchaeota archaeon]
MKILNANPPYNLFGIENPDYKKAKVAVLPIPYDAATTYRGGARDGPHAIIDASRNIELFSEELGGDASTIGIYTLDEMMPDLSGPEGMANQIQKEVSILLDDGKVPLLLGGDHSIAIGSVRAVAKKHKDFTVLHFDAHSDSRVEYMNSKYCHACIMARAREVCDSCYSIGVRSTDEDGFKRCKDSTIYRKDMYKMGIDGVVKDLLKKTKGRVYITIDVDVLDPSEMPSTGTPEPDGLSFYELKSILKGVLEKRELIGMDISELSPIGDIVAPNYLVAKLLYLSLGFAFLNKK